MDEKVISHKIRHELAQQKFERKVYENQMFRQKLVGAVVCILAIIVWMYLGEIEYGITIVPVLCGGLWAITTRQNLTKEAEKE